VRLLSWERRTAVLQVSRKPFWNTGRPVGREGPPVRRVVGFKKREMRRIPIIVQRDGINIRLGVAQARKFLSDLDPKKLLKMMVEDLQNCKIRLFIILMRTPTKSSCLAILWHLTGQASLRIYIYDSRFSGT
jgi:hypothetical protein